MSSDLELRDRLSAMESRLDVAAPPELRSGRSRRFALSFAAAPLLLVLLAGTAVAGAVIANQVHGSPGVENQGQPLAGAQLECMTPPQAAAYIAAHGITNVVWQVERDGPSGAGTGKHGSSSQQATAPDTGVVVPGAIVDGTLIMIADQRQGAPLSGNCPSR